METGSYTKRQQKKRIRRSRHRKRSPVDPNLLAAICSVIPSGSSVLDIGAGFGQYVEALRDKGYRASGIDGTPKIEKLTDGLVKQKELTTDCGEYFGSVDWGLFFEVGEHVPKIYESFLIDQVCSIPTKGLVVSWATIGQRGSGHINCQLPSYVMGEFCKREGWRLDADKTEFARKLVNERLRKRLFVFVKD